MAQQRFYGTVEGRGGEAGRVGTHESGLMTTAQSHNGDVTVYLDAADRADKKNKADYVSIALREHGGKGNKTHIYFGDMAGLIKGGKVVLMQYLWDNASKAERKALWKLMADKHLKKEFE